MLASGVADAGPTPMSIKTRMAAPLLHVSGGSAVLARRQRVGRILMFHGIDDRFPAAALEAQLAYVARHFTIVPLAVLIEHLAEPDDPASMAGEVALTFDDGLRNNFTFAYPVLRRLRAPATFFVCPELIDTGRWQWTHEVTARLRWLDDERRAAFAAELGAPATGTDAIKQWMKTLPVRRRMVMEESLRRRTARFTPTAAQRLQFDPMTWEDLRRLDPRLISIGSHTLTHPVLPTLTAAEATTEIRGSRRWLETRLDRAVEHFCYPDGAEDDGVVRLVRQHYQAAVTTAAGFVHHGDDRHRLRRIPTAEQLFLTSWRLHRPTA